MPPEHPESPTPAREAPPATPPPPPQPAKKSGRTSRAALAFIGLAILASGIVLTYGAFRMLDEEDVRREQETAALVDSVARAQTQEARRKLTSYGAVDTASGIYRVPIDTAKQILLRNARPADSLITGIPRE